MPFLHWFKKKPEINRTEPVLAEKTAAEQANTPETVVDPLPEEIAPGRQPSGQRSDDLESIPQNPASVAPEFVAVESSALPETLHLNVPIGAFYTKLPAYLLTTQKPDLTRSVQIAEEDVVLDRDAQEATLPLSILSLSCPDIFVRAVDGPEDVPITFSLNHPKSSEPPASEENLRLKEAEGMLPLAETPVAIAEADGLSGGGEKEIRLRLQPIFSEFPPDLEPPSFHSLIGTQAEITLPLGLIQPQLAHGRVVIPAALFCKALPNDLKPYFEAIDPAAEIPIPLEEVFSRIPPETIKLREDQEMDRLEEKIPTPFGTHAEEDAERFSHVPAGETPPVGETPPAGETPPVEETPTVGEIPPAGETPPANEAPPSKAESPKVVFASESKRLQAIFMTDEALDLAKTIGQVASLPGLRSCVLSTTDGLKLAGDLGDSGQEKAVADLLPDLFQRTREKLEVLGAGTLETITLYYDLHQLSTFVQGKLCLTVLHDHKPFKPGVREKIQAVMSELAALSTSEKPL